jgi:hypothetical protein
MSVDIRQGADGSLELVGDQDSTRNPTAGLGWITASINYNVPAADASFFVSDRAYVVKGIRGVNDVIGTGGACTAVIRKVASGTALASGVALHSGSYNLVGTAATNQTLTLSTTASDLVIPAGTRLAIDYTGTATSAIGAVTVTLAPA